jgi:hypothetical protein
MASDFEGASEIGLTQISQIAECHCRAGIQRGRPQIASNGVVDSALQLEHARPIHERFNQRWLHLQGPIKTIRRGVEVVSLKANRTQKVPCFGASWLRTNDLPADFIGFGQSAGLKLFSSQV